MPSRQVRNLPTDYGRALSAPGQPRIALRETLLGPDETTKLRAAYLKYLVIIVIVLAAQWIAACRQLSAQVCADFAILRHQI
jgi:hypothetical protein